MKKFIERSKSGQLLLCLYRYVCVCVRACVYVSGGGGGGDPLGIRNMKDFC